MTNIFYSIPITYPDAMSAEEAAHWVADEKEQWKPTGKDLGRVEITLDGDSVIITGTEKSPIRRTRRITGYLSTVDRFNDSKQSELHDREPHIKEKMRGWEG